MPLYRLYCGACDFSYAVLVGTAQAAVSGACRRCQGPVVRNASGLSATKIERLDNGIMARPVERPADAERLYDERARNADPLAGK